MRTTYLRSWTLWLLGAWLTQTSCGLFDTDPCAKYRCEATTESDAASRPPEADAAVGSSSSQSVASVSASESSTVDAASSRPGSGDGSSGDPTANDGGSATDTEQDASAELDAAPLGCDTCPELLFCEIHTRQCVACLPSLEGTDIGCTDDAPHCFTSEDAGVAACVACVEDANCGAETPVCDTFSHTCVGCQHNEDCQDPSAPRCEPVTQTCRGCIPSEDDPQLGNIACAHLDGVGVCSVGHCVECKLKNEKACGETAFCDVAPESPSYETCRTDKPLRSATVCEPCVSDSQCKPGQGCVMTQFGNAGQKVDVGRYCLWRQDLALASVSESDVKAQRDEHGIFSCTRDAAPYTAERNAHSLNSDSEQTFCGPAVSTCPALLQFKIVKCVKPGTQAVDAGPAGPVKYCGADVLDSTSKPIEDAVCQALDSTGLEYRCAPRCTQSTDCVETNGATSITHACNAGDCAFN